MDATDWKAAESELTEHLRKLIQFDTTNPPGNETPCIEYLATTLRASGYDPVVLESEPGRGNVIARFKGTGERAPLLLYGHVDAVPAETERWSRSPFSGDIADGCVWGRGALDMKSLVAQELQCMILLARNREVLKRDVIFAATSDEESGGEMGAGWLVENHPNLIRAEYGLSEGAGSTLQVAGQRFYGIRTAEKGTARFSLTAEGNPGHGSTPRTETSVHLLAEAIVKLHNTRLPLHLTDTTRSYVRTLAAAVGMTPPSEISEDVIDRVCDSLPSDISRSLHAVVRNTAVPTVLSAGSKINVIPSAAQALVDGRVTPGQKPEDLIAEVRAVVGQVVSIDLVQGGRSQEVEPGDPLYKAIERTVRQYDPDAAVIPVMLAGATDARWISQLGTRCLGFGPLNIPAGFTTEGLVHGHNERVPISALSWGGRVLYDVVHDFAAVS